MSSLIITPIDIDSLTSSTTTKMKEQTIYLVGKNLKLVQEYNFEEFFFSYCYLYKNTEFFAN